MAKPRSKKAKANTPVSGLLDALRFCAPASKEIGQPNQTHIRLANHWAIAFDGIVAMGHKIDNDIEACPHTHTLITALSKCTEATQITQMGNNRLAIQSGRFRASVPCLRDDLLGPVAPDPPCANINPAVVHALRIVGVIAQENAQRIMLASAMLRSGSAVATDGSRLMEVWHGVDLPTIIIPKAFINVLQTIEKPAVHFGFGPTSATFYFDDGSWIRSQLYSEKWPDIDRVLNTPCNPWPVPEGLKEALATITDLAGEDARVYFGPKTVRTAQSPEIGASCELAGNLPDGLIFDIDYLEEQLAYAKTVDWSVGEQRAMACFYGDNYRGMLMQVKIPTEVQEPPRNINPHANDPIPF
jgi:hypothetical protein